MDFHVFLRIFCISALFFSLCGTGGALEYIEFKDRSGIRKIEGRVLIEAQDGLVLEARDGQYFIISPQAVIDRSSDDVSFAPMSKKEMLACLKREFPESRGYNILEKEHFLIVYTTSKGFAGWYGQLLEKLYSSYINFWKSKGIALDKLPSPMVAVIYSNRAGFFQHAAEEGTDISPQVCAYYNKLTNRVVLCDLSGLETFREGDNDRTNSKAIQNFLSQPGAVYNVALTIHEATHQIGFNCGMHQRFAPYPLWVCEGLALLHEVPDRNDKLGWSIKARPNDLRLRDFKNYLQKRPARPIHDLIETDPPLIQPATALDNYAMAWGLTYYLVMKRPKDFTKYLKKLAEKTPLTEDSPEIRIREFEECFGTDWKKLYKDCGEYLLRL